jgi:acetolactate synthase regulatory subunit
MFTLVDVFVLLRRKGFVVMSQYRSMSKMISHRQLSQDVDSERPRLISLASLQLLRVADMHKGPK